MHIELDADLLEPGPIRQVRFDLTSRCNLRCVYCAVSHPKYAGVDMSGAMASKVIESIEQLQLYNPLEPIDLNGHGETTYREGWAQVCLALIHRGIHVRLTSNFAKSFTEDELEALACMDSIAISIDTGDRKLLKDVRRHVDVRQIVTNMALVKAAALKLHRMPPTFSFLCGLYDKNTVDWEDFARFAVANGVTEIAVWSLTPHPGLNIPDSQSVLPLDNLEDGELRPRIVSVLRGLSILRSHSVRVSVQGGFVEALANRVGVDATAYP